MERILVCIPTYQYVSNETIESVINLVNIYKNKYDIKIKLISEYTTDKARNLACQIFLQSDAEYLFFIDSDIIFDESILDKLIKSDKDIISAVYNKKALVTKETTIFIIKDEQFITLNKDEIPTEIFECEACGFGCVLIKREVIRELMEKTSNAPFRFIFNNKCNISEDIYFCNEVSKYGYKIYCDGTAKVGHLGKFIY